MAGTIRDKSTGKPVPGRVRVRVLDGNRFVKEHPALGTFPNFESVEAGPDGKFRAVAVPGLVLLVAGAAHAGKDAGDAWKPVRPDPAHPKSFTQMPGSTGLMFYVPGGGMSHVDGNWCKVLDPKPGEAVTQDVDLEPAARKVVKVRDAAGQPVAGARVTGVSHLNFHNAEPAEGDTFTAFNIEPGEDRLVVAAHRELKLVGAATVKAADADPVVTLGRGATVKGRAVDPAGVPLADVIVTLHFTRREVAEACSPTNGERRAVTDAAGKFAFDTVIPGHEFRLATHKGKKFYGPEFQKLPKRAVSKHGETKDLGDVVADTDNLREQN